MRFALATLLAASLAGCVSVRTVDVAPTPEAVAGFVASALNGSTPERISVVPADSVDEVWYATYPESRTYGVRSRTTQALTALDRVETFLADDVLVDVFVYRTGEDARFSVRKLVRAFGFRPLDQRYPNAGGSYYVNGPFVVRVLTSALRYDLQTYALDDGLGRPIRERLRSVPVVEVPPISLPYVREIYF